MSANTSPTRPKSAVSKRLFDFSSFQSTTRPSLSPVGSHPSGRSSAIPQHRSLPIEGDLTSFIRPSYTVHDATADVLTSTRIVFERSASESDGTIVADSDRFSEVTNMTDPYVRALCQATTSMPAAPTTIKNGDDMDKLEAAVHKYTQLVERMRLLEVEKATNVVIPEAHVFHPPSLLEWSSYSSSESARHKSTQNEGVPRSLFPADESMIVVSEHKSSVFHSPLPSRNQSTSSIYSGNLSKLAAMVDDLQRTSSRLEGETFSRNVERALNPNVTNRQPTMETTPFIDMPIARHKETAAQTISTKETSAQTVSSSLKTSGTQTTDDLLASALAQLQARLDRSLPERARHASLPRMNSPYMHENETPVVVGRSVNRNVFQPRVGFCSYPSRPRVKNPSSTSKFTLPACPKSYSACALMKGEHRPYEHHTYNSLMRHKRNNSGKL